MTRIIIVVAVVALALSVNVVVKRRHGGSPTQGDAQLPTQLDRSDFVASNTPWLVVAFTSSTCNTCADVERKVRVLESNAVAVHVAEYGDERALHTKYSIDAVPAVVMADDRGVVRAAFLGPVSATDLWAALARVRDGGHAACDHDAN